MSTISSKRPASSEIDDANSVDSSAAKRRKKDTNENSMPISGTASNTMNDRHPPVVIDLFENSQLSQVNCGYDDDCIIKCTTANAGSRRSNSPHSEVLSADSDSEDELSIASEKSSTNKSDPKWKCPGCTFENDSRVFACIMCKTTMCGTMQVPGVQVVDIERSCSSSRDGPYWSCKRCTFAQNSHTSSSCEMCGNSNGNYVPASTISDSLSTPTTPTRSSMPSTSTYTNSTSFSSAVVTPLTTLSTSATTSPIHSSHTAARASLFKNKSHSSSSPPVDKDVNDSNNYSVVQDNQNNDNNKWYDVFLNQCNITEGSNNNKYYRIQLLQEKKTTYSSSLTSTSTTTPTGQFYVWTKWGRVVGNSITGSDMKGPFSTEGEARSVFAKKYRSKTGNNWSAAAHEFTPKKKKYTKIDIHTDLMKMVDLKVFTGFGYSAMNQLFPLGVLSLQQMDVGLSILKKMKLKFENDERESTTCSSSSSSSSSATSSSDTRNCSVPESFAKLSSQFYTAIPHSFSIWTKPPIISTIEEINQCYKKCNDMIAEINRLERIYQCVE